VGCEQGGNDGSLRTGDSQGMNSSWPFPGRPSYVCAKVKYV